MPISTKIKKYIDNKARSSRRSYVSRKRGEQMLRLNKKPYRGDFQAVAIPTALNRPMPAAVKMKFYYSGQFSMANSATSSTCKNFRINSIWDPEYSVGAGQ